MTKGQQFNAGDWLHIAQIVVLIASMGVFYEKIDSAMTAVQSHSKQIERIEHYLSSKDANYWKLSKENQ